MWLNIVVFFVAAIFGFVYGKKTHLKQLTQVLLNTGVPFEKTSKIVEIVRTYKKTEREAKKATREEYKKMLVKNQISRMRGDDKTEKEVEQNG